MSAKAQVKISAAQAKQVYAEVPAVLRKLASERDMLWQKLAEQEKELVRYRTEEHIAKIASKMIGKKVSGLSFEDQMEQLKEAHANGKSLDVIEQAVDMTTPSGEIAKLGSDASGNGASDLENYLLGELP